MEWSAAFCAAGRQTNGDRDRYICPPVMGPGVVQDLVQGDTGKIGELHFDNRSHSLNRGPDCGSNHRVFADRRVQYAPGKFFSQTFCCFESATKSAADVLPIDKHAFVITEQLCLRLADCFEIGDAHSRLSTRSRVEIAHQSSLSASGGASFCAVAIASSTFAAASLRHSVSVLASIRFKSAIVCSATFKQSRANGSRLISSVT